MSQLELKKKIKHALETNDLDAAVSLAQLERKALSQLIRIAYDKDTLAGWRAIRVIGRAAQTLVDTDYDFLRDTVRKLLWSLSDESGGIGWAAPEILGEIVSADPEKFNDIVPLIVQAYEVEELVFRPGVLYALSRIAEVAPEKVVVYQKVIITALMDKDPLVKLNALDLIARVWEVIQRNKLWTNEYCEKILMAINHLKNDQGVAWVYSNDGFIDKEVGEESTRTSLQLQTMT